MNIATPSIRYPQIKILITPHFDTEDNGDGGIRRVVEAQRRYLPQHGFTLVDTIEEADIIACHAGLYYNTTKPVISHCHGLYWDEYEWPRWAHDLNNDVIESMRQADFVTAPSKWVARSIRRGLSIQPTVLYHGYEPFAGPTSATHSDYVLWNKTRVDAICDPYPIEYLAQLSANVDRKFITTHVSPNVSPTTCPPNLQITGTLSYVTAQEYVRNAGLYLATSRETFGIGTIEALACGIPILGWNWGGQAEYIVNGYNGVLVPVGDYDALQEGLEYCFSQREQLSQGAIETAKEFTWAKAIARYVPLYRQAFKLGLEKQLGPKVSVIIPTYNMGDTVLRAIDSVYAQKGVSAHEVEIVVVNDASTDNTADILKPLVHGSSSSSSSSGKPRMATLIQTMENNKYLAGALNAGIAASHGAYILPLDADNMLGPNAIAELLRPLETNRSLDVAYGRMSTIDMLDGTTAEIVSGWPTEFSFTAQLSHHNQIPSSSMYRRKYWERVGGYRRRCRTAEDADFWCRITSYGAKAEKVTDAVVLRYYNRPNSMSHTVPDWAWHAWYPWSRDLGLVPYGGQAVYKQSRKTSPITVPTNDIRNTYVSVIIPVGLKHTELVIDAVDSIIAQSFQNWEIIVVNDSGNPLKVHPCARVIDTPHSSSGPAIARNIGIAEANGIAILPLDADDYLQPSALEIMWDAFKQANPNSNEATKYIYTDWYIQETGEPRKTIEWDCEKLTTQLFHAVTALYPIEACKAYPFDTALKAWEDWDFALGIASKGYCGVRVPLPLLHYRLQTGGRREAMFADAGPLAEEMLAKWGPYIRKEVHLMGCSSCGGGNRTVLQPINYNQSQQLAQQQAEGNLALVQYIGNLQGVSTFLGPATGTKYRFGNPDDTTAYVYTDDAVQFVARGDFIYPAYTSNDPILVASTPDN